MHSFVYLSQNDMHPTATEKLTIHISVMYSAAHAVNTLYNILHDCAAASCPPPSTADINMQFLSASRCAVFTCRLSHVILQERTLILLHCPSTVNSCTKSTSFHSILTDSLRETAETLFQVSAGQKNVARGLKEKSLGGLVAEGREKQERSLSQLSPSSAR